MAGLLTVAEEEKLRTETKRLKQQLRDAESRVAAISAHLEDVSRAKFKLKKKRKTRSRSGAFFRTTSSDIHGYSMNDDAINAFLSDYEELQPRQHIDLGDLVDCGGFLAQHHALSYIPETNYTYAEDLDAANWFLDALHNLSPSTEITCLAGNHERRISKWCVKQTLRDTTDSEFLLKAIDPEYQLSAAKRGIRYIRQEEFYDGLALPGTIKLGHCFFTHGETASKHEAAAMVSKYNGNVVYAHTHRRDSFSRRTVKDGAICAWNAGCLCELQKYWNHTKLTDWVHGYGLQLVHKDGTFLHINVPIIDGKSYLSDFLGLLK